MRISDWSSDVCSSDLLAVATLNAALGIAREAGYLGANVDGSGRAFELEVRVGAGAYICGEETALLESLEGKRGTVRAKPPLPALQGLFGLPTDRKSTRLNSSN